MEKEAISSDAEMVGLPQSGGGRRQRMAAGGDTDLSQEDRRKTAASSAVLRPDELLTDLENNRPDASAASSRRTSRKTAGNRLQDDRKAATGCSREGNRVAADRLHGGNRVAADRLRGGKSLFVVRREMSGGSGPERQPEGDCRNGGAAAEAAAEYINEGCWDDESMWLSALAEAGISWGGTLEEFRQSEVMSENARAQWVEGIDGLRCRMREMMADCEIREPVMRTAAAFRDAFEAVNWKAREFRFAAFVRDTMEDHGGGERLTAVGEEIAELEERLQELKAEQQELEAEQQQDQTITVGNLAWNVTGDMLRGTFEQVAEVLDAAVQYDEDTGRSLGWAVVKLRGGSDAADAAERFDGVELSGECMVVQLGEPEEEVI